MFNKLLNIYNDHSTKIIFVSGAIVGLIVGLLVGWVIWPTSYYNATPSMLREDFRDDYLTWVAEEYAATNDLDQAWLRLGPEFWGKEDPVEALGELAQRRGELPGGPLQTLAQRLTESPPTIPSAADGEGTLLQRMLPLLQVCGAGLIALALAGLGYLGFSRYRRPSAPASGRAVAYQEVAADAVQWTEDATPPFRQYKTTYTLGDDFYDPSFSIEQENGDFLGECGIGISEAIGIGDPKKVTALEVWLFDKNDIRTITKVMMSEFAFNDEALRAKLASKGEMLQVQPGAALTLETATLRLQAQIVDFEYGQGQLPPNSFFQRLTVDVGIWAKSGGEAGAESDIPPLPE